MAVAISMFLTMRKGFGLRALLLKLYCNSGPKQTLWNKNSLDNQSRQQFAIISPVLSFLGVSRGKCWENVERLTLWRLGWLHFLPYNYIEV